MKVEIVFPDGRSKVMQEKFANIFLKAGKAVLKSNLPVYQTKVVKPEASKAEEKPKRAYKRRDMKAEE